MTSKTFKSFLGESGSRRLHVERRPEGTNLWVSDNSWESDYGITIAPSDAPALMLSIGDTLPVPDMVREGSYEHFLGNAIHYLAKAVKAQERATAEAKEQAELEAEALELFNTQVRALGDGLEVDSLDDMHHIAKESWLAVARRAREMRAEK